MSFKRAGLTKISLGGMLFTIMKKILTLIIIASMLSFETTSVSAYWIWTPQTKKWINPKYAPKDTPKEQFDFALGYFNEKDYKKAIAEFEKVIKYFRRSEQAPEAQYYIGLCHENLNNLYEAFLAFQKVIDNYPYTQKINDVVQHQYQIGELFFSGKKAKLLGMPIVPAYDKAVEVFNKVVENAPYGQYADIAQYRIGECYKILGLYQEAIDSFKKVIDNYPNSNLVDKAKFQVAYCSSVSSLKPSYDQQMTEEALDEFKKFVKEHPDSELKDEALKAKRELEERKAKNAFDIAMFYEKKKRFSSAIIYYSEVVKNFPNSSWAPKALEKIKMLESKIR